MEKNRGIVRWSLRLSVAGIVAGSACAMSCAGDDSLALNAFDGGLDAPSAYDAANDAPSDGSSDARADAGVGDAGGDSGIIDAGHDAARDAGSDAGLDAGFDGGADAAADAGSSDAGDDAGDGGDGGGDGGSSEPVVNGCTTYVDLTDNAASRVIQGPPNAAQAQYTPNCILVRVGQSVTWQQHDFSEHPLEPEVGDTTSPITETSSGATVSFLFSTAGTHGYHCSFHPMTMLGAVRAIP